MPWEGWHRAAFFLGTTQWTYPLGLLEHYRELPPSATRTLLVEGIQDGQLSTKSLIVRHHEIEPIHASLVRLGKLRNIQTRFISKERSTYSTDTFPLQTLLGSLSFTVSSLPEDRIYAYLGLVPERSWDGLVIDYRRSSALTYVQATWAMIKSTKSLSILSYVGDRSLRLTPGLPTWVPDYSLPQRTNPLDTGSNLVSIGQPCTRFDCTGNSSYTAEIKNTLSVLLPVSGSLQCTIIDAEDPRVLGAETIRSQLHVVPPLNQSDTVLNCVKTLPHDHFWRTLISDEDIMGEKTPADPRSAGHIFRYWVHCLQAKIHHIDASIQTGSKYIATLKKDLRVAFYNYVVLSRDYRYTGASLDSEDFSEERLPYNVMRQYLLRALTDLWSISGQSKPKSQENTLAEVYKATSVLESNMAHRLIFVTSSHRIGKGPVSTRKGDEVWILQGARVPYVLRPLGERKYELVGEAYIHDIMNGETFDDTSLEAFDLV